MVEIENSKRRKTTIKESIQKKEEEKAIEKEVAIKVDEIRADKKEKKATAKLVPEKPKVILRIGDRVRMFDGKAVGTLDDIEKGKATVNYGLFTSKVNVDLLVFVESAKK